MRKITKFDLVCKRHAIQYVESSVVMGSTIKFFTRAQARKAEWRLQTPQTSLDDDWTCSPRTEGETSPGQISAVDQPAEITIVWQLQKHVRNLQKHGSEFRVEFSFIELPKNLPGLADGPRQHLSSS